MGSWRLRDTHEELLDIYRMTYSYFVPLNKPPTCHAAYALLGVTNYELQ